MRHGQAFGQLKIDHILVTESYLQQVKTIVSTLCPNMILRHNMIVSHGVV
jgi:hypothetical protein